MEEYDKKFEEMKKYIPFLDNMITRLENTNTASVNPRQAQLDKIRSLRDLLLDKKKRMKMDNLLKCEQVLINLYAKVEQKDTLPGIEPASEAIPSQNDSDLNLARNKLKNVTLKGHDPDTLPEIARATETEVGCSGSKEPALFQRRPNRGSQSPVKKSSKDRSPNKMNSKRNYTRVLLSPDRSDILWSPSQGPASENLFSRRSPPKSSRRYSPYHKRERKKSFKQESHSRKSNDLNITLNVPEERLNSLNTKDILSRIITCSDRDVDIATLRELKTQILRELKQTGANEDISDLILKSYQNKNNKSKVKTDVEEGEISDSESEAIENIYGNLVVVEKDKNKDASSNQNKSYTEQDQVSRKIQICLVVNSDTNEETSESSKNKNVAETDYTCDITDFEMFDDNKCKSSKIVEPAYSAINNEIVEKEPTNQLTSTSLSPVKSKMSNSTDIITIDDMDNEKDRTVNYGGGVIDMNNFDLLDNSNNTSLKEGPKNAPEPVPSPFKVNFYKPIASETETNEESLNRSQGQHVSLDKSLAKLDDPKKPIDNSEVSASKEKILECQDKNTESTKSTTKDIVSTDKPNLNSEPVVAPDPEIPLLNEPTVQPAKKDIVSEIDILQALKNEILSDTISLPCTEAITPALHQPKVTKVSNAQELPKKRISIENYKKKAVPSRKPSLFVKNRGLSESKRESMKQSLKLTEKEVERFSLMSKIALSDDSDDDKDTGLKSPDGMDLAPLSPDMDITSDVPVSPPVIIPGDPVKVAVASSKADVDMRQLPIMSPSTTGPFGPLPPIQNINDVNQEVRKSMDKPDVKKPVPPVDPRVRKDGLLPALPAAFPNMPPRNSGVASNMTPNRTPNMTPSRTPNMTPNSRPFEFNPSRPFDADDNGRKHVYAPIPIKDNPMERKPVWEPAESSPVDTPNWEMSNVEREKNSGRKWEGNSRSNLPPGEEAPRSRYSDSSYDKGYNRSRTDRNGRDVYHRQEGPQSSNFYSRSDCPATPTPSFGRDAPSTPSHYLGRSECPQTPSHPFGRSESSNHSFGMSDPPRTPSHPFGRSEAPMTPTHPFGRSDAPMTPSHPFGRSEAPMTPSHPFGRSEAPMTPSHPLGRSEAPMTPSHPFGRSDYSHSNPSPIYGKAQDPRLNRSFDHESNNRRDAGSYNDRNRHDPRNYRNDPRYFDREQSASRNEPKPYTPDQTYRREQMSRREPSVGRSLPNGRDSERLCSRDGRPDNSNTYAEVGSRRPFQREQSVSRTLPDYRARASSVGRSVRNELSVESHAGRAFTIDTSVNSTFQKFLDSHRSDGPISFDARRQRASSVGRSLAPRTREPSVGRTFPPHSSQRVEDVNRDRFKRAQSVGRDLSNSRTEKSFKDIKAEFESYRNNDRKWNNIEPTRAKDNAISRDPRIRRESYDKPQDAKHHHSHKARGKEPYQDKKKFNSRDPRQRREQKLNDRYDRKRAESRDRHSYGISSDGGKNTPAISSVKNYKIPKIKRPESEPKPEPEPEPIKTEAMKTSLTVSKNAEQKSTTSRGKHDKKIKDEKKKSDKVLSKKESDKNNITEAKSGAKTEKPDNDESSLLAAKTAKRVTRRSLRKTEELQSSEQSEDEIVHTRTRRIKKVIYDTDSDDTSKTSATSKTASPKKSPTKKSSTQNKRKTSKSATDLIQEKENGFDDISDGDLEDKPGTLNSSFGLDGIDLFPDNIISDPVLDNINALIADLDNDLDTPKTDATCNDLFNDISIENMLEKMTSSPLKAEGKKVITDMDTTTNTVEKDLFDTLKNESETNKNGCDTLATKVKKPECSDQVTENLRTGLVAEQTDSSSAPQSKTLREAHEKNDIEPVVSTSVNGEGTSNEDQSAKSEKNLEGRSTPDSTNDAEIVSHKYTESTEEKPDSTNEKQSEMNSDISSTHDAEIKPIKENSDIPKDPTPQIDSIGSLLSILQDKSKIKELLSMLGDQSGENEKIKKKLEKLSEIVSDDEDTNDGTIERQVTDETSQRKMEKDKQDGEADLISEKVKDDTIQTQDESELQKPSESGLNIIKEPEVEQENKEKSIDITKKPAENVTEHETVREETTQLTKKNQEIAQNEESNDKGNEDNYETDVDDDEEQDAKQPDSVVPKKKVVKKVVKKRVKTNKFKKGKITRIVSEAKRVTRSEAAGLQTKPKEKKPSRELRQLQESIKEMFMSDAILNASGIRMCRLAKMVDEKSQKSDEPEPNQIELCKPEPNRAEPRVVIEKIKHVEENEVTSEKPLRKKPGPKPKVKPDVVSPDEKKNKEGQPLIKYRPGPKSKTKMTPIEKDPYDFETDSITGSKTSEKALDSGSDSEDESLASSKSFASTELLVELKKKPKRKRGGWKTGIIKTKNKKRKIEIKHVQSPPPKPTPEMKRSYTIPDYGSFTDKYYCFSKRVSEYDCRLCESTHTGKGIVFHYKKYHPHYEIPLSRMSPEIAREAIEQCGDVDFGAISKIPTEKYTCRFCFQEFGKRRAVLESFFWHVVSMHTGEYKQLCSECINVERCPFNLDIPPPPKDIKGQLIGYICGKCNFTQLSLENLKMHVINRHNDTETEVYTINFAVMTKSTINALIKRCNSENTPRTLRSTRSTQSMTEASDERSEITESEHETARSDQNSDVAARNKSRKYSFNSKITFENDDNASEMSSFANTESSVVKTERDYMDEEDNQQEAFDTFAEEAVVNEEETDLAQNVDKTLALTDDIMDYPHFKITFTDSGNKEYVCCINGQDSHYKTGLLISMKKHVQLKHTETWDGYCFVCKVIVTPQGEHKYSECLTHFLDKHIDNFPVLEKACEPVEKPPTPAATPEPTERAPTPYINVRPLADLVRSVEPPVEAPVALPVIETVVSLGPAAPPLIEPPRPSPTYPLIIKETEPPKEYKYEEAQAEVMSKKHRVVLDAMMTPDKLVQIFKCAGRFCSFTSDSAEDALLHASTHQRVGGTNALLCAYCDFDSSGNSIDLVSHVFKNHGRCRMACGLCFYRAAASQLVASHITRLHGTPPDRRCVLKSKNAPAISEQTEENMSRENAVPLYICKQSENEDACGLITCTFRTVTHTKFWEHLTQKHANAAGFICYICSTCCIDATALVLHLKTHGLKLYHCTLCVYGADNEPELLAHCSEKHPAKNPQAYIRTICGPSGNGSFKILPLVELKKAALDPDEVVPRQAKENPVKEAERSIELEKLIGHLMDLPAETPASEPEPATPISEVLPEESIIDGSISNLLEDPSAMATLIPVPPLLSLTAKTTSRPVTPAPMPNLSNQTTPVLKEEPIDTTPEKKDDVICLDSDDEDSKHGIVNLPEGIISLSDDESQVVDPHQKIKDLFKCGKCQKVAKSKGGFRKHTFACIKYGEKVRCAHCPLSTFEGNTVKVYLKHYMDAHVNTRLKCPICSHTEANIYLIRRHIKAVHKQASQPDLPSDSQPALGKRDTGRLRAVKRKSSGTAAGPPAKQKRYGPSDIDKLPINPILDESVFCDICEFNTKVRLNMVRHLQQHATQQPVAQTAPVNPVPHLETNEKHFDKMLNLASSSNATRAPEKPIKEPTPTVMVSQDRASMLPRFVPERYRYTCGASGCTYISVDEAMLKYHWETLHDGTYDFHCVHCPPHQAVDKSRPLSSARIIFHLKMHDLRLYACSVCTYYHYRRQILDKHMVDVHRGGHVLVVREESTPSPTTPTGGAPTMDLKPWQCGLCSFKSMLRPEVAEHCAKLHQSKMQYKCAYCPFRTSTPENVTKHQSSSHPNREPEIFHFYYREGSIPNGPDGVPHWQKQREKTGLDTVKAEADPPPVATTPILPEIRPPPAPQVDLNLVKQEIDPDTETILDTVEELCKKYGQFCEPNGLNFKCSLCQVVVEDSKEAMQSHLFEELQYRKWGCRLCSYKAFHQTGLKEHVRIEHNRLNIEPIELSLDAQVESWVSKLLDYQEGLIKKNREKLALQKMQDERLPAPTTSKTPEVHSPAKLSMEKLEKIFGVFGVPSNMQFCCPKCLFKTGDDKVIQEHLEAELTKIRWCCSNCPNHFSTYHEAQFHCKSVHSGQNARPVEAARDPAVRTAWVAAVIQVQKLSMNCVPLTTEPQRQESMESNDEENSLLVVRYEEDVPIPGETSRRQNSDSEDENLVIDELTSKRMGQTMKCEFCEFATKNKHVLDSHVLRHYNLKPCSCPYCTFNGYHKACLSHIETCHAEKPQIIKKTERPTGPPLNLNLASLGRFRKKIVTPKNLTEDANLVCLVCEKLLSETDARSHMHDQTVTTFAKRGDIVVKCSECLKLFLEVEDMQQHYLTSHPDIPLNYAYYKTDHDSRLFIYCSHCKQRFTYLIDLKAHHAQVHSSLRLQFSKTLPPGCSADGEPPSKKAMYE